MTEVLQPHALRKSDTELVADRQDRLDYFANVLKTDRPSLVQLAKELKGPIMQHRWDSVLGDDVSGRFIAVAIHRLMKRCAEETGAEVPKLIFVAPARTDIYRGSLIQAHREKISEYLAERATRLGGRTLVVSEFIATGDNAAQIMESLPQSTNFDLASLVVSHAIFNSSPHPNAPFFPGTFPHKDGDEHLFHGKGDSETPEIYFAMRTGLAGRQKEPGSPVSLRDKDYDPKLTQAARQEVIKMADEVYDEVFHTSTNGR